jgi:TatD DNase family protein
MYAENIDMALRDLEENEMMMIAVSNGIPSYERTLAAAAKTPRIIPAFGITPHNAADVIDNPEPIREYANRASALGEVGLDRFFERDPTHYPIQADLFDLFLQAAEKNDSILSIHSRGADREVLEMLNSYQIRRAVIHGFDAGHEVTQVAAELGVFMSFSQAATREYRGIIPQWTEIQTALRHVPDELLLSETDAPGMSPDIPPSRPLKKVIDHLSEVRGIEREEVIQQTAANMARLVKGVPGLSRQASLLEEIGS